MQALRVCLFALIACLGAQAAAAADTAPTREDTRLYSAATVLNEWQQIPDNAIPARLLERAQGIAVFPSVIKAAFIFGGRGGRGVVVVKDSDGHWSNPAFLTLAGGSFGLQWGVEAADVILVFTTRRGIEGLSGGKVTVGVDVAGAVGPVGRQMSGATDIGLSEVYSYSRAKGLFAGISLDGSPILIDHSAIDRYYEQSGLLASDIFSGKITTKRPSTETFLTAVDRLVHSGTAAPAVPPGPAATPSTTPAVAAPAPTTETKGLESGGASTFPLDQPAK